MTNPVQEREATCPLPVLKITLHDEVLFAHHNMPCPVCRTNHAVYITNTGICHPCWDCQSNGWRLCRPSWFARLFLRDKYEERRAAANAVHGSEK